jgi:glycosyltransferase involved in cell wall biosynthesis
MFLGKRIGVTVPAYNEEAFIPSVVRNMPSYVDRVYLVNDCSTDGTGRVMSEMGCDNGKIVVVNHETNKGVGGAIVTGYKKCLEDGMDIAVVMAGDDQMDPAELPRLLLPVAKGEAGYSKGNRMSSLRHMTGMPLWRRFGNWLLRWANRVSSGNYKVMDPQNGYAAASADALRRIELDRVYPYYGYCNDLLAKFTVAGVRVVEVSIPARYQGERSKIRYGKYIRRVGLLLLANLAWRMEMKWDRSGQHKMPGDRVESAPEGRHVEEAPRFAPGVSHRD